MSTQFTAAGVSTQNGRTKVRYATDRETRFIKLVKEGHTAVHLLELPEPMTRTEATDYLRHSHLMQVTEFAEAINWAWAQHHPTVRISGKPNKQPSLVDLQARARLVTGE
jgi:hypothetical protein